MADQIDWVAVAIFLSFFILVTVMGFFAARWKSGPVSEHLDEWGLGGRQFGTWITWFLVGGDFYTAYTVIAVPALVYSVGAYGSFAMPYIALQLIGMAAAIKALGLTGEFQLIAAFVVLALYTYSSGLRAPALIA